MLYQRRRREPSQSQKKFLIRSPQLRVRAVDGRCRPGTGELWETRGGDSDRPRGEMQEPHREAACAPRPILDNPLRPLPNPTSRAQAQPPFARSRPSGRDRRGEWRRYTPPRRRPRSPHPPPRRARLSSPGLTTTTAGRWRPPAAPPQ